MSDDYDPEKEQQRREEAKRQQDADIAMVQWHVDKLCEHFGSIHIFATRHESGQLDGTISVNLGAGDWYARYGKVKEWVIIEEQRMREQAISRQL